MRNIESKGILSETIMNEVATLELFKRLEEKGNIKKLEPSRQNIKTPNGNFITNI